MSRSLFVRRAAPVAAMAVALLTLSGTMRANPDPKDDIERVQDSMNVLRDLTSTPDKAIPRHLLDRAEAIVVIPSLVKGGFIIGAKHGKGVMSVRSADRAFSLPAFVTMSGGSIGWQIGVESVDLVLLVMNRGGVTDLMSDKFTLGGSASVAAGPVGRSADAGTDAKVSSQILAYSRTSGLFAGATLEGASLHGDKDANEAFYGKSMTARDVVAMNRPGPTTPDIATSWRNFLRDISMPQLFTGAK